MKEDQLKKIFAQLDRIARKLDYIEKSFSVFDGQDEDMARNYDITPEQRSKISIASNEADLQIVKMMQ